MANPRGEREMGNTPASMSPSSLESSNPLSVKKLHLFFRNLKKAAKRRNALIQTGIKVLIYFAGQNIVRPFTMNI